jgi:prolyl-tRNA synthetase
LTAINEKGEKVYPIMGCYGIGISRTMGVIVEKFNDERGIIWPASVAPFQVHLIAITGKDDSVRAKADKIYESLEKAGVEVLYDDREDIGAGAKLADADLIGNPLRVVVSAKTGEQVEMKRRSEQEATLVSVDTLIETAKSLT